MKKNDIISSLYLDQDINKAIKKMQPEDLQDDLRQEIFMVLCEMNDERLIDMHANGYLKYFLVRTMLNMMKSNRSGFYHTFRKTFVEYGDTNANTPDETHNEDLMHKLTQSFKVLHWYEQEIFKLYSENGQNILKLSRDTKIPYRSLFKTIRKVKTLLKYKIRNHDAN